jgi:hypothetical protein
MQKPQKSIQPHAESRWLTYDYFRFVIVYGGILLQILLSLSFLFFLWFGGCIPVNAAGYIARYCQ